MPANSKEYQRRYRSLRKNERKEEISMLLKMKEEIETLRKVVSFLTEECVSLRKEFGSLDGSLRKGFPLDSLPKESPSLNLPILFPIENPIVPEFELKQQVSQVISPTLPGLIRSLDAEFDEIWPFYPRKLKKGEARRAYRAARKKASFDIILHAVKRFAVDKQTVEPTYIPYPASWLNGESWLDQEHKPNGHIPELRRLSDAEIEDLKRQARGNFRPEAD